MRLGTALAPLAALLAAGGATACVAPGAVETMLHAVREAAPLPLGLAAACYALSLTCAAACWRPLLGACGGRLTLGEACSRYATGSLANSFLPARAGDALRAGLFARALPGSAPRLLLVAGVVAAIGAFRWTGLAVLAGIGAASSPVSVPALATAGAVALLPLGLAAVLARRGSQRIAAVLAPIRTAGRTGRAGTAALVAATLLARVTAAALVARSFGLPHPLAAAVLVVPALELAGIFPLTPGNLGVAGGAAGVVFHLQGAPVADALAAGMALHALETVTSVAYGTVAAISLARRRPRGAVVAALPRVKTPLREAA